MQQRLAWKKTRGVDLQCWHLERGKTVGFWLFHIYEKCKILFKQCGFRGCWIHRPPGNSRKEHLFQSTRFRFFSCETETDTDRNTGATSFWNPEKTMMTHGQLELPAPPNLELSDFLWDQFLRCGGSGVAEVLTRLFRGHYHQKWF